MAATTNENKSSDFPKIGAPAQRALATAGYCHLAQLPQGQCERTFAVAWDGPQGDQDLAGSDCRPGISLRR